ncbi:hypothetical protein MMC26_002685 [Xylographa opegraphella]|nr:hypothetical protein [Xylographa opegraphella]
MAASWIPFIFATLQSQAYKLGRYVAAGSWCEITREEKIDFQNSDGLNLQPLREYLLVDIALVNLRSAMYGSGRFLLPSESPTQAISTYCAIYNEAAGWFEVSVRGNLRTHHAKQELGVSEGILLEPNDTEDCFLPHSQAYPLNNTTAAGGMEYSSSSEAQGIIGTPEISKPSVVPIPSKTSATKDNVAAPNTVALVLKHSTESLSLSSCILDAPSVPAYAYYESKSGCDWASMLDDEDEEESYASPYYHSPSGEDCAMIDEEYRFEHDDRVVTPPVMLPDTPDHVAIDGSRTCVSTAPMVETSPRHTSSVLVAVNKKHPSATNIGIESPLPNLRQYIP